MKKIIVRVIKCVFLFLMFILLLGGLFKNTSQIMRIDSTSMLFGFIIFTIILFFFYFVYRKIMKKINLTKKLELEIIVIASIPILIFLILSGYLLRNYGDSDLEHHNLYEWDLRIAIGYTNTLVKSNDFTTNKAKEYVDYVKLYSNSSGVVMMLFPIYKIYNLLGGKSLLLPGITLNIICIYLSFLLAYAVARKIFDKENALFYFLIIPLFTPLFINASVFWSDTLSMPFLLGILAIFLYNQDKMLKLNKKSLFVFILIGILTAIGSQIKMTVILMTMGIFSYLLIKNLKNTIVFLGEFLLSFGVVIVVIKIFVMPTLFPYSNGDLKLHYTHYIMMGLAEENKSRFEEGQKNIKLYGTYNINYVYYSLFGNEAEKIKRRTWSSSDRYYSVIAKSKSTSKERSKREVAIISKILKERNFRQHINFFYSKYIQTWADGSMYLPIKVTRGYESENFLGDIVRVNGPYFDYYYFLAHYIHMALIFFVFMGCVSGLIKEENDKLFIIKISILLLMCLLSIWETRSRYIMNNLLLLYMLAIPGFNFIYRDYKKK